MFKCVILCRIGTIAGCGVVGDATTLGRNKLKQDYEEKQYLKLS